MPASLFHMFFLHQQTGLKHPKMPVEMMLNGILFRESNGSHAIWIEFDHGESNTVG